MYWGWEAYVEDEEGGTQWVEYEEDEEEEKTGEADV